MQFFFKKNKKKSGELPERIANLCEGLVYMSESDAPVTLFAGAPAGEVTAETIFAQASLATNTPVAEVEFQIFFTRLTKIEPWHDDAQREQAKKFLELQTLLEENLRDLKVFKVGRIRLDIYVVGIDQQGNLLGIKTQAVET